MKTRWYAHLLASRLARARLSLRSRTPAPQCTLRSRPPCPRVASSCPPGKGRGPRDKAGPDRAPRCEPPYGPSVAGRTRELPPRADRDRYERIDLWEFS
eukprot:scaffold242997_cov41-Tisochrysis_lutea.AAC.1